MDLTDALRRLRSRMDAVITRAVISKVNDALKTQRLKLTILADEEVPDVEHLQPYGLSFTPPVGAQALALAVQGARSHTVAICAQHPDERPQSVPPSAGGLYTKGEWRLYIDPDGVVCVGSKDSPQHLLLGDIVKAIFEVHTHPTAMGPSGPPANASQFAQALSKHKIAP